MSSSGQPLNFKLHGCCHLQIKHLGIREVKCLGHSHTARKQGTTDETGLFLIHSTAVRAFKTEKMG